MADEQESASAIQMDRGLPLENTPYPSMPDGRRRLTVKIGNEITEPIPVLNVSGSGTAVFQSAQTITTPGVSQDLITYVTTGTFSFFSVKVSCYQDGTFHVLSGLTLIGSARTGPATPNASFDWILQPTAISGTTVKVTFKARTGSPISDVEAYLIGSTT